MDVLSFCLFAFVGVTGQLIMAYPKLAERTGWSTGLLFSSDRLSWVTVSGLVAYVGSLVLSVIFNPWWSAIAVYLIAAGVGTILTRMLREKTQLAAIAMLFVSAMLLGAFFYNL